MKAPNPAIQIYARAFRSRREERKLLLVNKRNRPIDVTVRGATKGPVQIVDESTHAFPAKQPLHGDRVHLPGLAVAVVRLPQVYPTLPPRAFSTGQR